MKERRKADPYSNHSLLSLHLQDTSKFVKLATQGNAFVRIVPFDISTSRGGWFRIRYRNFVNVAEAAKIPTWSLETVFANLRFSMLAVNNQDGHPNEFANRIGQKR